MSFMARSRVLVWASLLCSSPAAADAIAESQPRPSARTTIIVAPPLQRPERDPCWRTDRPGTIDAAAMAPIVGEVLEAVRTAATQPGGIDAIEIEIIGEMRKATINVDPPFDPEGKRMRG